jgi:DNA repair exonuclease SbcCD ATPase subunit
MMETDNNIPDGKVELVIDLPDGRTISVDELSRVLQKAAIDNSAPELELLQRENQRLRSLLERAEWAGEFDTCPVCGENRGLKHSPGCELKKELNNKRVAGKYPPPISDKGCVA